MKSTTYSRDFSLKSPRTGDFSGVSRLALLLLAFAAPQACFACNPSIYEINGCDRFTLSDPNHALHVVGAFATTVAVEHVLRKAGVEKTKAILISGFANYVLWTTKEFAVDEFPSSGNNIGNAIGVATGMLFAISFD